MPSPYFYLAAPDAVGSAVTCHTPHAPGGPVGSCCPFVVFLARKISADVCTLLALLLFPVLRWAFPLGEGACTPMGLVALHVLSLEMVQSPVLVLVSFSDLVLVPGAATLSAAAGSHRRWGSSNMMMFLRSKRVDLSPSATEFATKTMLVTFPQFGQSSRPRFMFVPDFHVAH